MRPAHLTHTFSLVARSSNCAGEQVSRAVDKQREYPCAARIDVRLLSCTRRVEIAVLDAMLR